jgi:hypothetical protein
MDPMVFLLTLKDVSSAFMTRFSSIFSITAASHFANAGKRSFYSRIAIGAMFDLCINMLYDLFKNNVYFCLAFMLLADSLV